MNKITLAFFVLLSSFAVKAQTTVNTEVNDATIFFNSTQITRNTRVPLEKGENVVEFLNIEGQLNVPSLQVLANEGVTILSSTHQVRNRDKKYQSSKERKLNDSMELLNIAYAKITRRYYNFGEEKKLILSNKEVRGASSGFDLNDLTQLAAYYRKNLNELDEEMAKILAEQVEINLKKNGIEKRLSDLGFSKTIGVVTAKIVSNSKQTIPLQLKYIVNTVYWEPFYDIKATDLDKPLNIITKAKITQNSGVHWDKVNLTLSTTIPSTYGVKPVLTPWILRLMQYEMRGRNLNKDGLFYGNSDNLKGRKDQSYENRIVFSNATTAKDFTTIQDNILAKEYSIGIPYSIKNSGNAVVEIQENESDADFYYYTAPKIDKNVYLIADISEWEKLDLLSGTANIYLNGVFMGRTYVSPSNTEDTMSLMIGQDKTIQADRKKMNQFCKNSTFGANKKTEMAMQLIVKNNKSKDIRIIVEDQIPVSSDDKIEVTTVEVSKAKYNKKTGLLTWEYTLKAGESVKHDIKYEVKHPKNKRINL